MIAETPTLQQPTIAPFSGSNPVFDTAVCSADHANPTHCSTPQFAAALETWIQKATSQKLQAGESAKMLAEKGSEDPNWPTQIPLSALIAEWSLGEASVSDRLVAAWIESSDIHRLAKLADQLVAFAESNSPANSVLKLMTITAALLGIMRPQRARRLLQQVQLHHADVPDLCELLAEAERWTLAGLLLTETEPNHRVFWNNRLRNPNVDWNWETNESRDALRVLSPDVATAPHSVRSLFQAVIPNFWWELFADQKQPPLAPAESQPASNQPVTTGAVGSLVVGSLIGGVVGTVITFFWFTGLIPQLLSQSGVQLPIPSLAPLSKMPEPASLAAPRPSATARPLGAAIPVPSSELSAAPGLSSWRVQEIEAIRQDFPAIERLHLTLRNGTLDQALPILRGSSSIAETHTPSYQALLKWAVLDPPTQPDVRRAVIRLFGLTLPTQQSFNLMERLAAPSEPHAAEFKQMASIMLTAGGATLAETEIRQLSRIVERGSSKPN